MLLLYRLLVSLIALVSLTSASAAGPTAEEQIATNVFQQLLKGDYGGVTERFSPTLKKSLSEETVKSGWESLMKQYGAFQKTDAIRSRKAPDGRLVVVVTGQFARGALDVLVYFDKSQKVDGLFLTASPVTKKDSPNEKAARLIVAQLNRGEFDRITATFDQTMTEKLSANALSATWKQIHQQLGDFQSITAATVESNGPYERAVVTCKHKKATIDVRVTYDATGKVAGLFFSPHKP